MVYECRSINIEYREFVRNSQSDRPRYTVTETGRKQNSMS